MNSRVRCFTLMAALVASACSPTATVRTSEATPPTTGSTGSTSGSPGGGLCSVCQKDTDCGEEGSALCIFEAGAAAGHCAPTCVSGSDCDPGASCTSTDANQKVCYPASQTCDGWVPITTASSTTSSTSGTSASTTGSTAATTTSGGTTTSGATSGGATTTTGSSSTTGSSTGSSCPGYADPNTPAPCTCASGHTCTANNCYGGWYCELSTDHCVAPPTSCGGSGTGGTTSTSSTSTSTSGTSGTQLGGTSGSVGFNGGTVTLLHFGISGDTRPPSCEDTANYPTAIIDGIGDAEKAAGAQFALDLGDHMYVCNEDLSIATAQMNLFVQGTQHFGGTWFMTMGNHECEHTPCLANSSDANYTAFMNALAPVSNLPYYSVNVQTSKGLATFVFVADNAFDQTQANWLDQVLTQADSNATYTIVSKHHPEGDTSVSTNAQEMQIIRNHKFALLLTGHAHRYQHQTTDNGRDLILGNGGAPLVSGGTFNGYGMVDQLSSGNLQVTIYDLASGAPQDQFQVSPN